MVDRRRRVWATLKHYLMYTTAGFVVLGGLGAIWSHRPVAVNPAVASDYATERSIGVLAQVDTASAQAAEVPSWALRMMADLGTSADIDTGLAQAAPTQDWFLSAAPAQTALVAANAESRTERRRMTGQFAREASSEGVTEAPVARTFARDALSDGEEPGQDQAIASIYSLPHDSLHDFAQLWSSSDTPIADEIARETQKIIEVRPGDTLFGLLTDAGLSRDEANDAIGAIDDVFSPRNLQVGQEITLNMAPLAEDAAGQLVSLSFEPDVLRDVSVTRSQEGAFVAAATDKPLVERHVRVTASINSSLFDAAQEAGLPVPVVSDLIKTFSFDVDFQRDIQDGDRFEVLYERVETEEGVFARAGHILYASLTLGGQTIPVYYFERDGIGEYYNLDGETIRKSLLRTPIDGARVTSGFGMRMHPVLGYSKMHKGVDFGAPTGTPIFAAGSGTIIEMGRKGAYGNYIRIKHNGLYQTAYAHISSYAKGLKKGDKVSQGDVIAYVGSTGRATGPHLHYEIMVNGEQVNPAKMKTSVGDKLAGNDLKSFKDYVAKLDAERARQAEQQLIAERAAPIDSCSDSDGCEN